MLSCGWETQCSNNGSAQNQMGAELSCVVHTGDPSEANGWSIPPENLKCCLVIWE